MVATRKRDKSAASAMKEVVPEAISLQPSAFRWCLPSLGTARGSGS